MQKKNLVPRALALLLAAAAALPLFAAPDPAPDAGGRTPPPEPAETLLRARRSLLAAKIRTAYALYRDIPGMAARIDEWNAEFLRLGRILRGEPGAPREVELRGESGAPREVELRGETPAPGLAEEVYLSEIDESGQPFWRYLPSSWSAGTDGRPRRGLPLLVFLHGYSPDLNVVNWAVFPDALTNAAERLQAAVAMPFARGNTDFQGIGEQDVFRVVEEMQARFGTDPDRVALVGYSMGGMGALTIARRFPERFAGALVLSGRGDWYDWKGVAPDRIPPWERELVDDLFLRSPETARMRGLPILAFHGAEDTLNPLSEILAVDRILSKANPEGWRLEILPGMSHWLAEHALSRPETLAWLRAVFSTAPRPDRPAPHGRRPGEGPSLLQNAFLAPFVVTVPQTKPGVRVVADANPFIRDWIRYAHGFPHLEMLRDESGDYGREPRPEAFPEPGLFVFGEPETCPLLATLFQRHGVEWTAESITLGGRTFPRRDTGFWITFRAPDSGQLRVLHCGVPWGRSLPPNHKFDLLPDILVYKGETRPDGANVPVAAAKSTPAGIVWYPQPPTTNH